MEFSTYFLKFKIFLKFSIFSTFLTFLLNFKFFLGFSKFLYDFDKFQHIFNRIFLWSVEHRAMPLVFAKHGLPKKHRKETVQWPLELQQITIKLHDGHHFHEKIKRMFRSAHSHQIQYVFFSLSLFIFFRLFCSHCTNNLFVSFSLDKIIPNWSPCVP